MNSMQISNYLEKIRLGRKMRQVDFIDGIVSLRQYQRYRNGECDIPYENIDSFATKLSIPTQKLMKQFEAEKNKQSELINKFYNAVVNKANDEVDRLKRMIENDIIIDEEKKVYFHHALILNDFFRGKVSRVDVSRKISNLIGFPDILKQVYYTDVEVLIMSSLLEFLDDEQKRHLLDKLTELYDKEETIMSGGTDLIHSLIIMRLTKSHGSQKNYTDVIRFADLGIQRGLNYKQYYLFDYFFYYKALAHYALEDYESFQSDLFRCYNTLHMEGNQKKIKYFSQKIEKDFDIVFDTFIMKYMKKYIM